LPVPLPAAVVGAVQGIRGTGLDVEKVRGESIYMLLTVDTLRELRMMYQYF